MIAYSILVPGLAFSPFIFRRRRDVIQNLTVGFVCGLSYLLLACFMWALFNATLYSFIRFLPGILLPALLFQIAKGTRESGMEIQEHGSYFPRGVLLVSFIAVLVLIFILVLKSGPPLDFTKDTLDHAGYVNEIRESGRVFPSDALYADAGANGKDIRKGLIHFLYAFYSRYLGIDTLLFLRIIGALFAVLMLRAIYSAGVIMLGDERIGVLASILFLISAGGGLATSSIREYFYPNKFGMVLYLFFLASFLDYLENKKSRGLYGSWLFAFAACAVHVFYSVLIGFALLVTAVWKVCFPESAIREHWKRTMTAAAAALLGIIPYAAFRYFATYNGSNAIHSEIQGVVFITNSLFISDPFRMWRWFGPFGLFTFLAIIPLWSERKRSVAIGFLIASFISIPLVLLNPLLLPLLSRFLTYLILRIIYLCPFYILGAVFLRLVLSRDREKKKSAWSYALFSLIILALTWNLVLFVRGGVFSPKKLAAEKAQSYLSWRDGLDFLGKELPARSIIASDPLTSYSIPAFTSHYVVCTLDQHAPPNDLLIAERVRNARDILSPFVDMQKTTELLLETHAEYVVINGRIPTTRILHYWSSSSKMFPLIEAKFAEYPDIFDTVFKRVRFIVLRWNGKEAKPESTFKNPYFLSEIPNDFSIVGKKAGEACLDAGSLGRGRVTRGDTLTMRLLWSSDHATPLANYTVSVRFDKKEQYLAFNGKPFPKIARKLHEKMTGELFRFRSDHKIAGGFLSPDTWPRGMHVLDEFLIHIPSNMAPGRYNVRVKMLRLPNQPTYRLHDFFYDDDVFQGIKTGEVVIH